MLDQTRQQVIAHHINMAVHNSALTFRAYATAVRDQYEERTPVQLIGKIKFHRSRDVYADERLNAQIVRRLLDDLDDLPCAIEESLVLALPYPYQGECLRELAGRYGQLAAAIPASGNVAAVADGAMLMRETGEALTELAQCLDLDGGQIMPAKRALANRALGSLADIEAVCETLKTRLQAAMNTSFPPLQKAS